MKAKKLNIVVSTLTASTIFCGPFAEAASAQQSQTAPPVAPSFLKQAGQKLLDSAQKQMLHKVNTTLQGGQQAPATTTTTTTTTDPLSTATTAPTATAGRQAAPCRSWMPQQGRPTALLLCVHGLGLQSNSYEYFAQEQSRRGLAVFAIDVRGFGTWMNNKGKTKVDFDDCLLDIKQAAESIRAANPGLPLYVLGESMGGAIALRAASLYPDLIDGLVSSVPASERFGQGKTSVKVFLNLLTGMNLANVGQDVVNQATKNAKLKNQWEGDPLARLNLTPQELIQFQDFMNSNHDAAKKLADMPVLFVQGTGDQLVKPEGTWELFNSVASKDKSFFAVPGEHLIFEEAQTQDAGPRDQNFRVINSWLTAKVGRRQRGGMMAGGGFGGGGFGGGGFGGGGGRMGGFAGRMAFLNTAGLEGPSQMIDNGQYTDAIAALEPLLTQRPNDPNVMSLLGRAYYQSGQSDKAGYFFRRAMRSGQANNDQNRALNSYLLGITQSVQAGLGTPVAGAASPWGTASSITTGGKAKIYAFYANWMDQCKGMIDSVSKLSSLYGTAVEINPVNIEDSKSTELLDKFKVGPIPTVVFVAPSGQVGSTIIGESNYNNYEKALQAVTNMTRPQ